MISQPAISPLLCKKPFTTIHGLVVINNNADKQESKSRIDNKISNDKKGKEGKICNNLLSKLINNEL